MGDNFNEDMAMDVDLNQDPLLNPSPSLGLGSLLNELETSRGRIEDRIRQLEAARARARQRQRWRQARNNPELAYVPNANDSGGERGRNCKRDISQLANALEMDLDVKKNDKDNNNDGGDVGNGNGDFFDCSICLDSARDPILTCCGHLFCWVCFYQLSYVGSSAKECPVCRGEVTDSNITPIYGNGKNPRVLELESGVKIPPRPHARRAESARQQGVSLGGSQIPVAEALRRIRMGYGSIRENPFLHGPDSVIPNSGRLISEGAASLSSFSSALNNAQRLVGDLVTYFNDRALRRADAMLLPAYHETETFVADTQSEPQTVEMNHTAPSQGIVDTTVVELDNLSTDTGVEIDETASRLSPSSARRNGVSRALNLQGGAFRELRRRRPR